MLEDYLWSLTEGQCLRRALFCAALIVAIVLVNFL